MRIAINLATRPYADLGPAIKHLRIAMAVLLAVAIGLGFGLRAFHQKAEEARASERALDGKIAQITQERQGYQEMMRRPGNVLLLTQTATLNRLFDEKSFSWTLAMEDLETVLPKGVQVVTLEPARGKDGHITLHLRVIGPRDRALELVQNLEHSRHFLLPRISGESTEASGNPGEKMEPISASNRVNFDLLADYNPSAPVDSRAESGPEPAKTQAEAQPATQTPATQTKAQPAQAVSRVKHSGTPRASRQPLLPLPVAPVRRPPVLSLHQQQQSAQPSFPDPARTKPNPSPNPGGPQ